MAYTALKNQKRILVLLIGCVIIAFALIIRLVYIQVIKSNYYQELAYDQQTRERKVEAKRGTIYDSTGEKVLAQSISVNVVTAIPKNVGSDSQKREAIAKDIAEILEINADDVVSKFSKNVASVTVASKVDDEKATKLLKYISQNKIEGISVDEDTKRIYPYGTLMSHVLGFVGTDNQGLLGVESYYDNVLSGVPGKIVGSTDLNGRETPFTNEQYIEPEDGKDIVLTIDATIQSIVEKYLYKAYVENVAEYATAVVLRPSTGEVLAMSNMPTFDSNDPFTPNTDELKNKWDTLTSKEKSEALNAMWRNKCISDTAEPGSTFKIVTAAAALEEGIVGIDTPNQFNCNGSMSIGGWNIRCWRYPRTHGSESLRQGIMNSCNPVFMQISQRLGIATYNEYLRAFNLAKTTGIDLPGEQAGIMHNESTMSEVDAATTSFGQTIQVTTLRTAVNYAAIANGGYLVNPYVVKEVKSGTDNFDKKTESKVLKQIVSTSTANDILSALESTVTEGTGKAGKVSGYRVAGKTGTGEEGRGANATYMASFAGIAPVNSPEVVVVLCIYDPKGPSGHQGSTICAPVVGSIIDETLRYLNIPTDYTVVDNDITEKLIPDVTRISYQEAKEKLEQEGFKIASDNEISQNEIITEQIPKAGASLMDGSTVRVYTSANENKQTVSVPDVRNKSSANAIKLLRNAGLNIRVIGKGTVLTQDPSPNEVIEKGSIVTIKCVDMTDMPT